MVLIVNKQRGFTERRKANRIFIPQNNELRNYLLKQFYDNSGHLGRKKTISLLSCYFIGTIFLMMLMNMRFPA